jgi:hypothetical protein
MIRSELRITPHYSGNSQPPNSPQCEQLRFARASQRNRTKANDRFRAIWVATLTDCYWPGAEAQ